MITGESARTRYWALGVLLLVYIFNFVDRQIIGILAQPIKRDLGLTDTQLGLMGGIAFALFYTGLGIPIARLADRKSRVKIVAISLGLWSGFTALCGFASNFWQLFLARMGVGVGEAGGVAPSYSLISDTFPPQERARAYAVFSFGIPIGSALGIFFGGWVAHAIDWRTAFIIVGAAGLLIVPLLWLTVPEPPRGRFEKTSGSAAEPPPSPPFGAVIATLAAKKSFWFMAFGAASSSITGYGLLFWLPSFFQRSYHLSLVETSMFYGTIILLGGVVGTWAGGVLGDKLGQASKRAYALVPAAAFVIAVPCFAVGVSLENLAVGFFLFLIPQAMSLVWLGPVITAIQQIVAPSMRATASAIFLFINNLLGIGIGTFIFGYASDLLTATYGDQALRYSILYGLSFYAVAALLFVLASKSLERDWHHGTSD